MFGGGGLRNNKRISDSETHVIVYKRPHKLTCDLKLGVEPSLIDEYSSNILNVGGGGGPYLKIPGSVPSSRSRSKVYGVYSGQGVILHLGLVETGSVVFYVI